MDRVINFSHQRWPFLILGSNKRLGSSHISENMGKGQFAVCHGGTWGHGVTFFGKLAPAHQCLRVHSPNHCHVSPVQAPLYLSERAHLSAISRLPSPYTHLPSSFRESRSSKRWSHPSCLSSL
uniref:Uncharacterized protein n=1 Tax=Myotis myotis TaxID=51298 RepID=A0A7J7WHR1_MYOMY|nr:hypothetical protein mMyoMyo1_012105 [Myotis myotis]